MASPELALPARPPLTETLTEAATLPLRIAVAAIRATLAVGALAAPDRPLGRFPVRDGVLDRLMQGDGPLLRLLPPGGPVDRLLVADGRLPGGRRRPAVVGS